MKRIMMLMVLLAGCAPSECDAVLAAVGPIQRMAESGDAQLSTQVDTLEAAAGDGDTAEIAWLVAEAGRLRDHIASGSMPGAEVENYYEDKMRLLDNLAGARRDVIAICE